MALQKVVLQHVSIYRKLFEGRTSLYKGRRGLEETCSDEIEQYGRVSSLLWCSCPISGFRRQQPDQIAHVLHVLRAVCN